MVHGSADELLLMLKLSRIELENWADAILKDFLKDDYEAFAPINIEKLATEYLGLNLFYKNLSDNLDIYGVSAFQDTIIEIKRNGENEHLYVKANTILIETELQAKAFTPIRRFTIGHEAAHQILRRLEYQSSKHFDDPQFVTMFNKSTSSTVRFDLTEWQANTLCAALIMPARLIDECMFRFGNKTKITVYGADQLDFEDSLFTDNIKSFLGVSKTALLIRLKQLNYVEYKPIEEYAEKRNIERMKWLLWQKKQRILNRQKKL